MSNMILSYQNRIDAATFGAYGSWEASLPLTNLQNRSLSKVARSTSASNANTRFRFTLDTARIISAVGFVNHNLSSSATYRYSVYSDSGYTTLVYDSGTLDVWTQMPYGTYEWEDLQFWDLTATDEDLELFTKTLIFIPTASVSEQYYQVEFFDSGNADGYVQLGRVFVGAIYQPTYNMNVGASIGYETGTLIDSAISGAEYFDRRESYRVARFTLADMDSNEAALNNDIQKICGTDAEVLFVYDPNDEVNLYRRSFLGRIRSLSPIEQPYATRFATSYEIKELL